MDHLSLIFCTCNCSLLIKGASNTWSSGIPTQFDPESGEPYANEMQIWLIEEQGECTNVSRVIREGASVSLMTYDLLVTRDEIGRAHV